MSVIIPAEQIVPDPTYIGFYFLLDNIQASLIPTIIY